jgi:hypothetical protein
MRWQRVYVPGATQSSTLQPFVVRKLGTAPEVRQVFGPLGTALQAYTVERPQHYVV